jgi:aryl-alcohol dehydrogenase-like predicted oxidoreductase
MASMEYRNVGNSGLQVSAVGLGCNNFGEEPRASGKKIDFATTQAIIDKALDLGVTFFDTADVYGEHGTSEEVVGRALKAHRRDVVIATKFGVPMGEGPYWSGGSRRYIMDAVDASLRRLGTDYIDLYQLHLPDRRNTPIEETLRALDDVVKAGKVRYIGSGTMAAWQLVEAHWAAKTAGLTAFVSANNRYNLLQRGIERDFVPVCRRYEIGVLPYYPLAGGLLTGKYRAGEPAPEGMRLATRSVFNEGFLTDRNFDLVAKLQGFAEERGHSILELAIGWLASQPHVPCVFTGATSPEQIEENVRCSEWRLTADELDEVDEIMGIEPAPR